MIFERYVMCDYSLHNVRSRQAEKDDQLVLGRFGEFRVIGFGRPQDGAECVTCVPYGTSLLVTPPKGKSCAALFGHNDKGMWRDGLIFFHDPNSVVSLQKLPLGTRAKVVNLPHTYAPESPPVARVRAEAAPRPARRRFFAFAGR